MSVCSKCEHHSRGSGTIKCKAGCYEFYTEPDKQYDRLTFRISDSTFSIFCSNKEKQWRAQKVSLIS